MDDGMKKYDYYLVEWHPDGVQQMLNFECGVSPATYCDELLKTYKKHRASGDNRAYPFTSYKIYNLTLGEELLPSPKI